ncbi:sulfotransferase family protein [Ruegeria sp. SCP11]|uniref:sulfotransferase-like domain-containing protein n=1 Tax=Ruegeria sp. SCP11 TaxID=3141378 RepID=UPI00333AC529
MHKIIALWAIPRSTSTAFEHMMKQRGDLDCLHEPFGQAWYQGEEPMWPRFPEGGETISGLSLESVWEDIQARAEKGPVFIKDFPHYINHMWDAEFLSHFTHAFLIRNPAKTITSMYDKWPDFDELEIGFPEQRALFDLLTAIQGNTPFVIDSDDLLENPAAVTKAFCEAVDIPFIEEALTWEARNDPSAHSWCEGGAFHTNLAKSTGLRPQKRKYVSLDNTPRRVQRIYHRMMPHYLHVHKHRLRLPQSEMV